MSEFEPPLSLEPISGRYFAHDGDFPPDEVPALIDSLKEFGFYCSAMQAGNGEVAEIFTHPKGLEVLIIASQELATGMDLVEVTGDFPTGPIIRDGQ